MVRCTTAREKLPYMHGSKNTLLAMQILLKFSLSNIANISDLCSAILGEDITIRRLKERFNWPGYSDDVSGQKHVGSTEGTRWGVSV